MRAFFIVRRSMIALAVVFLALPANAYHVKVNWPYYNFYWLSSRTYHGGQVTVVSNNCTFAVDEQAAILETYNETNGGQPELGDMSKGYNLSWKDCSGVMTDLDDILLAYEDPWPYPSQCTNPNDITTCPGGYTEHFQAPATWCALMETFWPCGDHYVVIHMNLQKINAVSGYPTRQTLKHELGHATGLDEHCTSDSVMNNGSLDPLCNGGAFHFGWQTTDRQGLYACYHPHDTKNPPGWQAVKVVSDGAGGLQIAGTPMPRADINRTGLIFVGWLDDNGVWNMAYSGDDGATWTIANEPMYFEPMSWAPQPAAMLAHHDDVSGEPLLSFYAAFPDYYYVPTQYEIWRITWSSTAGWGAALTAYSTTAATAIGYPLVAHSQDHIQRAIVWTESTGGTPTIKFSFIASSGAFTGPVETVQTGSRAGGLVFDENGNPKVIYRVFGAFGTESGTGARRIRDPQTGWGAEQTFTIDGLTEPDVFLLLETEQSSHWYGDCPGQSSGVCNSGTYAGIDHYALKHIASPLTFRYRQRRGGTTPDNLTWSEQDIDFTTLPWPITGPNTVVYRAHGLTRLIYAKKSLVVGTVWTSANVSKPFSSDLWFIK